MAASQPGLFNFQGFSSLGDLGDSHRLYTYAPSTTTHKDIYTDQAGTIPHTYTSDGIGGQYIALNARGELPAPMWLATGGYDICLKNPFGVTIWTRRAIGQNDQAATLDAALRAELVAGTFTPEVARIESGGAGGTDYNEASFVSRKNITGHAWYDFLANSTSNYAGGAPIYGHASFNDNNTFAGSTASDHHHSFQSYPHYGTAATLGVLSSFWSQLDTTAGTVTEATGVKVNNPLGAGTITTMYGVKVEALTRGGANWGVHVTGPTASFFGGPLWLGTLTTGYAYLEYNSNLGHLQMVPRTGFCVKIGAGAGDRKLRFGDPTTDATDATIESVGSGNFVFTPRSGFRMQVASVLQVDAPVVFPSYTVAGVPPAVDYPRGMIYVSNEAGGAVMAFSDGTDWRRVTDRAVIS